MAAFNSAKDCGVCKREFNEEERCPRSLPCSHCLCTDCIGQLIARNQKICPFCHEHFKAKSPNSIGINTNLLEVLKLLRRMEQSDRSVRRDEYKRENTDIVHNCFKKCREAFQQIESAIVRNNAIHYSLQQNNLALQNELISALKAIEAKNVQRMMFLHNQNLRLQNQKKILNEKLEQAEEADKSHAYSEGTEAVTRDIQTWLQSFKAAELTEEKEREEIEKASKSMTHKINVMKEFLNSSGEDGVPSIIPTFHSLELQDTVPVTIETLQNRTQSTIELIRLGRIFALLKSQGRQRIARLSLSKENRICLHRLKEDPLPSSAHTLEYCDVMRLVNTTSVLAFWELSDVRRHNLGRMYISLKPGRKRSTQFSLMCTGETGPSFANTCCFGVKNRGEYNECAGFGDYEYLGGAGGKAVVPGVWQEEDGELCPWLSGMVQGSFPWEGEKKAAQVFICTRSFGTERLSYCYGKVEEGLDVLAVAIAEYPNIQNVVISDCGLVLPI